jgi:hypothetical protein
MKSIEFLGLPGAGKSTVYEACILGNPELMSEISICAAKKRLQKPCFRLMVVILIQLLLRSVRGVWYIICSQAGRRLLAKLSIRLKSYRECAATIKGEVILHDSGFIMPLLTGVIDDGLMWNKVDIASFLESFPMPAKVILVHVDRNEAFKRFYVREQENNDVQKVTMHAYDEAEQLLYVIVEYIHKKGVDMVQIDNTNLGMSLIAL